MSEFINKVKTADGQEFDIRDERVQAIYTEGEKAKLARMQEVFTTQEKMKLDSTEIFTVEEKEKLAGSASITDVEALEAEVATKASATDVGSLQEAVTELVGDLSNKADVSTVDAAKSNIEGTSLVIPEQEQPEPVATIDGVAYYHKQEFDLEELAEIAESSVTKYFNLLTGDVHSNTYPHLQVGTEGPGEGSPSLHLGLAYGISFGLWQSTYATVTFSSRAFTVVDTQEEVTDDTKICLPTCSAYYGFLSEDGKTFISYYNLKGEGGVPEFVDSIKQGDKSIPLHGKDMRLPDTTAEDVGKVLAVNDQGELVLQQASGDDFIEVTYAELKALRDSGGLTPGKQYRMTDYNCVIKNSTVETYTYGIYTSAGHMFDLVLTAESETILSEDVRAMHHAGDTYFANNDLSAWRIKYCLDNDTARCAWVDNTCKGFIYQLIDEFNNDAPYDFKNIRFRYSKSIWLYGQYKGEFVRDTASDANGYYGWAQRTWKQRKYYTNTETPNTYSTVYSDTSGTVSDNMHVFYLNDADRDYYTFSLEVSGVISDRSLSVLCHDNYIAALLSGNNNTKHTLNRVVFCGKNALESTQDIKLRGIYGEASDSLVLGTAKDIDVHGYFNGNLFTTSVSWLRSTGNINNNILQRVYHVTVELEGSISGIVGGSISKSLILGLFVGNSFSVFENNIVYGEMRDNKFAETVNMCKFGHQFEGNVINRNLERCEFGDYVQYVDLTATASGSFKNIRVHNGIKGAYDAHLQITVTDLNSDYTVDYYASGSKVINI